MKPAQMLVRAIGGVMLALGLVIWTGQYPGLIPVHMLVGVVFVLSLWSVAYLAARAGAPRGLAVGAVVLGLILPIFGLTQQQIAPGDAHVVIQVIHLALGLSAIGIGEALGAAGRRSSSATVGAARRP